MKRKLPLKIFFIAALALIALEAPGRGGKKEKEEVKDSLFSDAYLDTVNINRKIIINDYSMIGVLYGVGLNRTMFNPTKKQTTMITPVNVGVFYTKYGKMFGYMPYFGLQAGVIYGKEGYEFKANDEGVKPTLDGAEKAVYEFVELPVMSHFHLDTGPFKLMANLGMYGGYRLSVQRTGKLSKPFYKNNFYPYDRRFDYGISGGLGFAFIFSPIEFHVNALLKFALSSLYKPDYNSPYYYRFAYPFNVIVGAGIHFQLNKRTGKTKAHLRKEAYDMVFEDNKKSSNELQLETNESKNENQEK